MRRRQITQRKSVLFAMVRPIAVAGSLLCTSLAQAQPASGPTPLISPTHPVEWWAAFKFNVKTSPTKADDPRHSCRFGGEPKDYKKQGGFSQGFVFASSDDPALAEGTSLIGTGDDPLGATFC
jgi:hypothetical protein